MARRLDTRRDPVKERAFLAAYLGGPEGTRGNKTQAAIWAGVPTRTAAKYGAWITKQADVQRQIDRYMGKLEISAEKIFGELAKIAFSEIRSVANWSAASLSLKQQADIPEEAHGAIAEIIADQNGLRIKMHNKLEALGLLTRILKGTGRLEPAGQGKKRYEIVLEDDDDQAETDRQLALEAFKAEEPRGGEANGFH